MIFENFIKIIYEKINNIILILKKKLNANFELKFFEHLTLYTYTSIAKIIQRNKDNFSSNPQKRLTVVIY